jgi:hypothetical protein
MITEIDIAQTFTDSCIKACNAGELTDRTPQQVFGQRARDSHLPALLLSGPSGGGLHYAMPEVRDEFITPGAASPHTPRVDVGQ